MSLPSSLTRNNRNTMMYADAISSVWAWWDLIADPSYALREDLDIWEVMQRDPKVYQGVQQRLNAIAGREWRVMPRGNGKHKAAKIKASILDAMLRRIPHFQDARRRLAQSVFRGQSTELICGRREFVSLADQPSMMWWVCTGLEHMDQRRFVVRPIREKRPDGSTRIRGKLYVSVVPTYQTLPSSQKSLRQEAGPRPEGRGKFKDGSLWYGRYAPVEHPEWLLRIVYDDEESRLGFGRGIQDAIYFFLWVKSVVLREGLQGLERFVHGVPILKLDPSKRGATDQASETVRDAALDVLKKMRAGHAIVINSGEELVWAEPGSSGHQMAMAFLDYIDRSLMSVITGASLKSGGDSKETGSYASDAVGMEVADAVVQYDRDKIDEDIGLDLIGLLCRLNRPQFEALGKIIQVPNLADEPDPVFVTVVKRKIDPLVEMQIVQGAQMVEGFDILKSEVYEVIGHSMPEEDDDVFEGGAAQQGPEAALPGAEGLPEGMPMPNDPSLEEEQGEEDWPDGFPEDNDDMFGGGSPEDDATLFEGPGEEPGVQYVGDALEPGEEDPFGNEEEDKPEEELLDGDAGSDDSDDSPEGASETGESGEVAAEEPASEGEAEPTMVGGDDAGTIPEVQHDESGGEAPGGEKATGSGPTATGSGAEERAPVTDPSQVSSPADVVQGEGDSGAGSGSADVKITPQGPVPESTEPKQAPGPGDASKPAKKGPVAASETAGLTVPVKDSRPSEHGSTSDDDNVTNDLTKKGKKGK